MTLQNSRSVSQPSPKLSNLRQNMIGTWSRIFSANGLSTFAVQNRWLSTLKLEPPAEFRTSITVESGSVYSIDASLSRSMGIYPTFQASAGMVEEYLEYPARPADRSHYEFPTPVGKPYLRVRLDSHATPIQRQHAFGFSFDCLIKPGGGCDVPCDYLPSSWNDWKTELQERRLPGWPWQGLSEKLQMQEVKQHWQRPHSSPD